MRRRNTESLRDVIQLFLKQQRLDQPLNEKHLMDAWPKVLGDNINQYTTELTIRNKILYVKLSSSVLRHDLFLSKQKILESLNSQVGQNVINDIVFK